MKKLLVACFLVILISCDKRRSDLPVVELPDKTKTKLAVADVSGKVFEFGPDLNPETCEISAECDCCASDFLFIDGSRFVLIAYCLEGDSFLKGKYEFVGSEIRMTYQGDMIVHETNWERESDSTKTDAPDFFEKIEPAPKKGLTISREPCSGDGLILKLEGPDNDFGAEKGKLEEAIAQLKASGVWQKLKP